MWKNQLLLGGTMLSVQDGAEKPGKSPPNPGTRLIKDAERKPALEAPQCRKDADGHPTHI